MANVILTKEELIDLADQSKVIGSVFLGDEVELHFSSEEAALEHSYLSISP